MENDWNQVGDGCKQFDGSNKDKRKKTQPYEIAVWIPQLKEHFCQHNSAPWKKVPICYSSHK